MEPEPEDTDLGVLLRGDFGDKWPLTVPYVFVASRPISAAGRSLIAATITVPDGSRYAINGTAKAHTPFPALEPSDPVWADHHDLVGLKKDLTPLLDACRNLGTA